MKKIIISLLIILASLFMTNVIPVEKAFAAKCGGVETSIINCEENEDGIKHVLQLIIDIMSIGIGILGVVGISVVGIQYLTAGGNEEKTKKAKRRLFEIVLGLVVYVAFAVLMNWLLIRE